MSNRKLWKVVEGGGRLVARPESKVKVYDIYVRNARAAYQAAGRNPQLRYVEIYVDERGGRGWQLYERVDLAS